MIACRTCAWKVPSFILIPLKEDYEVAYTPKYKEV